MILKEYDIGSLRDYFHELRDHLHEKTDFKFMFMVEVVSDHDSKLHMISNHSKKEYEDTIISLAKKIIKEAPEYKAINKVAGKIISEALKGND